MQKTSLIDYPGKISCVLFVSGCNFACPYCHNPELARGCPAPDQCMDESTVISFLRKRAGFLEGVVISGGEPTLATDLAPFCEAVKSLGYAIKLDTNGSRPEVVRSLIAGGLVDYISMDVKTDPQLYPRWIHRSCRPESILSSIRTILAGVVPHEFRTTCIRPLVDARIVATIAGLIKGAALYALQECRPHRVLNPEFIRGQCMPFSRSELAHLHAIALPWVNACTIR